MADLHAHPRQRALFADLPDREIEQLKADLERNGLREPIRMLPDGTILCGHQRVRAARQLGWTTIDAIVVNVESEAEAEHLMIMDNIHRRHMGPIGFARLYSGLVKTQRMARSGSTLRDEIADRLGHISGRQLDRYRRLLKLPPAITEAIEAGRVTVSAGLRILGLPEKDREKIAREIEAGAPAKKVIAQYLRGDTRGEIVEMRRRYRKMQVVVRNTIDAIGSRLKDVVGFGLDRKDAIAVAQDGRKFFDRLLAAEKRRQQKCDAKWAQLLNGLHGKPTKGRRSK
jgi:ParB/RepB/Spo0J family partition protein